MSRHLGIMIAAVTLFGGGAALAQSSKYHVTEAEKAACQTDASLLCGDSADDEDSLLACMKAHRTELGPHCRPVFENGLRKRRIPL